MGEAYLAVTGSSIIALRRLCYWARIYMFFGKWIFKLSYKENISVFNRLTITIF